MKQQDEDWFAEWLLVVMILISLVGGLFYMEYVR